MSMKKTDLYKNSGLRIENEMKQAGVASRFGSASGTVPNRREQRKLDQEQGLVPFAVKINANVVQRVQALAQTRAVSVSELVDELLRKGLEG